MIGLIAARNFALLAQFNYALFFGGSASNVRTNVYKYGYADNVASMGQNLTAITVGGSEGAGNFEAAILKNYNASNVTSTYTYADEINTLTGSLNVLRNGNGACSNKDFAYFWSGGTGNTSAGAATSSKYTWSAGTWAAAATMAGGRRNSSGFGNDTIAYVACGNSGTNSTTPIATVEKQVYATNVRTSSSNQAAFTSRCAFGNTEYGFVAGGVNGSGTAVGTTHRVVYADDTNTAFTGIPTFRYNSGGASNANTGVVAGGVLSSGSTTSTTAIYSIPTNTWTVGSDTAAGGVNTSASASGNPGGLTA